jgi:glycosyltransferase involved in cell wall biosynthesis
MAHPWNASLQQALAPIPAVVMVHDPRPHPGLVGQLYARFENASLRSAAACLILSSSLQPDLERRGVPPAKIAVVPHGPLAYPAASTPASQSAAQTLLFLGRITTYKGLEVLLAAFELLSQSRPSLRLCIAGEGSLAPYRTALARLRNVEIINRWLDDAEIGALLSRATLLALPYTNASQSGVLAAAAGFGLPVIATHVGGLPEQITSGSTGLLVAPGSVDELVMAIERLLDDPAYAAQLGAALKRDFAQNRSWEAAAGVILKVCEQLQV